MKPIRIGIIGTGQISQTAHIPVVGRMDDFDLVGLCDVQKNMLQSVAARIAVKDTSTDYRAFVSRDDIDAVIIATPTDTHHPIGLAALRAGKHVLIEKPLATTVREAEELTREAQARDLVLMVGMNHRFKQDNAALKNFIHSGELGTIFMIQAGWLNYQSSTQGWFRKRERAGGGVFMDLGIVMIDLILWLLDFPRVDTVSASMFSHKTKHVEDSASCFFRLGTAASVSLQVSWNASVEKQQYYLDVIGSKGSASVNPLRIHKVIAGAPANVTPVLPDPHASIFRKSYEHELRHFAGAIRRLHPVISTGEEAAARMHLVEAAYRSASSKREISL
jgi:predicted dehydrogenase